ncbi:YbbR-like domain-containing protein [Bacteroides caecigallinarum]|uniref:CdaR family protein n=1 Tax=Bacteroides caecigallinarum TaxID=1411144 RepID=UPI0019563D5A|nr:YbbR-like domain-containing protein [Bacteroides caecigallinarum]MBM6866493.1 YbbR-like domain-containing protein [Bacteroides caecigallinarum]
MFGKKNIKDIFRNTKDKVRDFLLTEKCREFLIFLFFVAISFGFWMLQTLDGNFETEFTIPLRLKDVPKDVVITSDLQDEVRVKVEDRGTVLLNYMLGRSFLPISINFSDYENSSSRVVLPYEDLRKRVSSQLNSTTKLLSVYPDSIGFVYSQGKFKKVPVSVSGKITPGIQYYISDIKLSPDSVIVYAPAEVLKTVQTAYTMPLDCEDLTENTSLRTSLKKIDGAKYDPSFCDVSVSVDMYSEKTVEVPVVGIGFPANKTLRTFPSKVKVTFKVGLSGYSSVNADDFFIGVKYSDLLKTSKDNIDLVVTTTYPNVSNIRVVPSSVDYLIEESVISIRQ